MTHSLSINLSLPAADSSPFVLIEQQEWDEATGHTTVLQGLQNIGAAIFGGDYADANCGGTEPESKLYLYPSSSVLAFYFSLTWGQLGCRLMETVQRDELQQCNLQDRIQLDYPAVGPVQLEWLGEAYSETGDIVPRPFSAVKGSTILLSEKVYGTLRCSYHVYRIVYSFTLPEREDSIENNFQSVAVARWSGGFAHLPINLPDNFELTQGNCGNGSSTTVNPDDENEETEEEPAEPTTCPAGQRKYKWPVSVTADRHLLVNYCQQSANSNELEEEVEYEWRCSKYAPDYSL